VPEQHLQPARRARQEDLLPLPPLLLVLPAQLATGSTSLVVSMHMLVRVQLLLADQLAAVLQLLLHGEVHLHKLKHDILVMTLTCCQDEAEDLCKAAQTFQQASFGEEVHKEQQRRDGVVQRPQHWHQQVHVQPARCEDLRNNYQMTCHIGQYNVRLRDSSITSSFIM
jgi:hypothetical protein